ncbi:hypothetical protein [Oceanobacillus locisalsi]|uniref:DUF1433 domain-containing protein n=1 Tax=Oceanobacillus locisalsi TaxID=546107 RepID=A0ABW3NG40_9BACI
MTERYAKQERFTYKGKKFLISTVDLQVNHGFLIPLYYETMIFNETDSVYCKRYSTKDEAIKGHQDTLKSIKNGTLQLIDGCFEEVE